MSSIWENGKSMPEFPALDGDTRTEILIIGGGIAGILCAYMLEEAGADYLLVEQDRVCGGVTGKTTGKITAQHGLIYHKLLPAWGKEKTKLYWEANRRAVEKYKTLARDMDCDFAQEPSYVFSRSSQNELRLELEALGALGIPGELVTETPLPFPVAGALKMPGQARFHPLKFLGEIARNLHIYEHTKVQELAPGWAKTDRGVIHANKIIVCTHFPMLNKHGGYPLKLYQHRSYLLALQNAPKLGGMYVSDKDSGFTFRNHKDLLLLGGDGHRTGKNGSGWERLRALAKGWYPKAVEVAHWATQDCVSLDGAPYVGLYSPKIPELFVATGFNKWGLTTSMAAAEILCDLVQGRANIYAPAFDPNRKMLLGPLAANAGAAAMNLLTPTVPRCPHLGCALKYNKAEHSWDCPCHGSRFDETGQVLDNPATDDMKKPPDR